MGTEIKPLGVKCNIQCQYCYQNPIRDAGNLAIGYDLDRIKAAIDAEGGPFTLFGGEPLLMPKKDLENLWAWGLARFERNSIQTNGTLIDDEHIVLFKRYRVDVGISLDGVGELNDARWCGTLERTRSSSAAAQRAIEKLCGEGICPAIITTLHRANATLGKLPALFEWIRHLDDIGVRKVRIHLLENESPAVRAKYGLSTDENIKALLGLASLEKRLRRLRFDLFSEMRNLLCGQDQGVGCVWTACDPYTTPAVQGIEGNGDRTNCGRTNKDGIDYLKAEFASFERYLALFQTPQESGGCKGCRFFLMCKGQCPGTAIGGDWRNRSEYCGVWKAVYTVLEEEMAANGIQPLSTSPRRADLEQRFIDVWSHGQHPSLFYILHPTGEDAE